VASRNEEWYVAEGQRGQRLLDQGEVGQAAEVFEAILARLGGAPSYNRAVILGRLGRCSYVGHRPDLAMRRMREAIDVVGRLAPSDGVRRLRGTLRSDLGDALRACGEYGHARKAYEAALKIAEELKDIRAQAVELARLGALALAEGNLDGALTSQQSALRLFQQLQEPEMEAAAWHQLGRIYHRRRQWDEAERHYREAARVSEERGDLALAAQTWNQLAVCAQDAGSPEAAEAWLRKAIDAVRRIGDPALLGHCLSSLAGLLQGQPGRLAEARQLAEEALFVAQGRDPASADAWTRYGVLAEIIDKEARTAAAGESRSALEMQARDYRELQQRAPLICAALARLDHAASHGRAILLRQLGRSFHMGRRPDLAAACHREAIGLTETLAPGDEVLGLRGALYSDLRAALVALGHDADARAAQEKSMKIAGALQERWNQAPAAPRSEPHSSFDVTRFTDLTTEYIFDEDLLIDGQHERRITRWTGDLDPLSDGIRPTLPPCTRAWPDEEGAIRFSLVHGEPVVEGRPGCTLMRWIRHEVAVSGSPSEVWRLIAAMDGRNTVAEIMSGLPADRRPLAARMLAALAAAGAIDVSGRPVGGFLHMATKKGVLPAGGLEGDAVLHLATDGQYREYPGAVRLAVGHPVPDRLRTFHALTRARRSSRDYRGVALRRDEFDALLHTACGVTGSMPWAGRDVKLRAYPSSGALYAVEIYPVVFRVEGLAPAVYHYRAVEHELEVVRQDIDQAVVVEAALPVERAMVAGAPALFCLAGCFPRHERKYGEGGYRMLVAEAGHISQNLVLAATALGLNARPFGGVFDGLLNHVLGFDRAEEQFLLAILVGHGDAGKPAR
jgi:SagB-type dehydrogenase family enzyme